MIVYVRDRFGLRVLCGLTGSVFPKAAVWAVPCGLLAALFNAIILYADPTNDPTQPLDNEPPADRAPVVFQSITLILGLLTVFRNTQAYSRFWEGAELICEARGEWTNAVSSVMSFCCNAADKQEDVTTFQHLLVRLFSMLHCAAPHQISDVESASFEILDQDGIDSDSLAFLEDCPDKVETIMLWIQKLIIEGQSSGVITVAPPILSRAFQELSRGSVHLNNVRKIRDIPFPYPYAQVQMLLLVCLWVVAPAYAATYTLSPMHAFMASFMIIFSYMCIFYITIELEQPFGDDINDLPIADYQKDMNRSLRAMLHPMSQRVPKFVLKPEAKLCKAIMPETGVLSSAPRFPRFNRKNTPDELAPRDPFQVWSSHTGSETSRPENEVTVEGFPNQKSYTQSSLQSSEPERGKSDVAIPLESRRGRLSLSSGEPSAAVWKSVNANRLSHTPLASVPSNVSQMHLENAIEALLLRIIEELRLLRCGERYIAAI